jgi:hypothetical protein
VFPVFLIRAHIGTFFSVEFSKTGEEHRELGTVRAGYVMQIPFGKYEGEEVADLPDDYLLWLAGRDLYGSLRAAVRRELRAVVLSLRTLNPAHGAIRHHQNRLLLRQVAFRCQQPKGHCSPS